MTQVKTLALPKEANILAIDFGEARIGLAITSVGAKLPRPLSVLRNDDNFWPKLEEIIRDNDVRVFVVGLPLGLSGLETAQTKAAKSFAGTLEDKTQLPVYLQDETLTSVKAEAELTRSKSTKATVDSLAATYILEDFVQQQADKL